MTSKEAVFSLSEYIGRLGGGEMPKEEDAILYDLQVLAIIKAKRVNVNTLTRNPSLEQYNLKCAYGYELSVNEFKILKEWLENEQINKKNN